MSADDCVTNEGQYERDVKKVKQLMRYTADNGENGYKYTHCPPVVSS